MRPPWALEEAEGEGEEHYHLPEEEAEEEAAGVHHPRDALVGVEARRVGAMAAREELAGQLKDAQVVPEVQKVLSWKGLEAEEAALREREQEAQGAEMEGLPGELLEEEPEMEGLVKGEAEAEAQK